MTEEPVVFIFPKNEFELVEGKRVIVIKKRFWMIQLNQKEKEELYKEAGDITIQIKKEEGLGG